MTVKQPRFHRPKGSSTWALVESVCQTEWGLVPADPTGGLPGPCFEAGGEEAGRPREMHDRDLSNYCSSSI